MSNSTDFDLLVPEIEAIPDKKIQLPAIPVTIYNQEGENLYHWAIDDKDKLVARGLDVAIFEGILSATGACRHAEALWHKERYVKREAEKEWSEKSPEAYDLRDNLVEELEFAYVDDTKLLKKVDQIKKGTGHADMIQDLHDIYVLGTANTTPLEKTNFDMTLLEKATEMSDQMAGILAAANGDKTQDNAAKKIRDKAYTVLKIKVDEVRRYGKFVFREDEERKMGYLQHYKNKHR